MGLHSPQCFCTSSRTSTTFFLQKIISKITCQTKLCNKLKCGQTAPQPPHRPCTAEATCIKQQHRREMSSEWMLFLIWFVWGVGRGQYCLLQIHYDAGVSVSSLFTGSTCETIFLQWEPGDKLFLKMGRWKYPNLACRFRETVLCIQVLLLVTVTWEEVKTGSFFLDLLAAGRISYACYPEC